MRVLITHELYPPDIAGGGEHVVMHTAQGLRELGAHVKVLTTGDPTLTAFGDIETKRLPVSRYRFNLAVEHIVAAARDADVIQTFTYHACLPSLAAARYLNKPIVMTCLGLFGDAWRTMRGPAAGRCWQMWERFLITRAYDRIVFLSDFSLQQGVAMGVAPTRALVDMPGVDTSVFCNGVARSNCVLFVGKVHIRKGFDRLLAVAKALPHVPFRVVGWGPDEAAYRELAPPNIVFTPFPGGEQLWPIYQSASIFFLPSRAETFGMAILQAMAGGCAVVSTVDLPFEGARLDDGNVEDMTAAIARLWQDQQETRRLGERNAQIAREFTWHRFANTLAGTYEELNGGPSCR